MSTTMAVLITTTPTIVMAWLSDSLKTDKVTRVAKSAHEEKGLVTFQ